MELEHRVFATDRLSRRSLRHFLSSPTAEVIVAESEGGQLAGTAIVLFRPRSAVARLYSIAVAPQMGGRGVAPMLLEAAEEAALARDCRAIRLEVHQTNHAAISRYRKSGYRDSAGIAATTRTAAMRCGSRNGWCPLPGARGGAALFPPDHRIHLRAGLHDDGAGLGRSGRSGRRRPSSSSSGARPPPSSWAPDRAAAIPTGWRWRSSAAASRPEVYVSRPGPYFLDTAKSADKRRVMQVTQLRFPT